MILAVFGIPEGKGDEYELESGPTINGHCSKF